MPFDAKDQAIQEQLVQVDANEQVAQLAVELGLTSAEYLKIKDILQRQPTVCEVYIFSLMWSEHCSYKHSKSLLRTLPTQGPAVLQGPGENAGVVDIGDGDAIAFKIESHNHPSAIEPFEGAATGVGGIIRDIFTMGARPIAVLDSLAFGTLDKPRQRYLFEGSVAGIGHYGNCLGVPTVGGEVTFNAAYEGNCLINAMAVGLLRHENLTRAIGSGPGNPVLLIGSSTGRDGIGGASVLASQSFDEEAQNKRPAVQVGDPFMEKLLIEACLELLDNDLLLALGDLGAAGLTSSASEMASRGGVGIKMDVAKVHRREQGMQAYEVMVSESQERMLAVAKAEQIDAVIDICAKWDIPVSVIGEITDSGRFEVIDSASDSQLPAAYIPADILASSAPELHPTVQEPAYIAELRQSTASHEAVSDKLTNSSLDSIKCDIYQLLTSPNIADKSWIYRQYDHQVQLNSAVLPGSDAAVVRIGNTGRGHTTTKAIALTTDSCGRKSYIDPYLGAQYAIAESLCNISCVGAKPLGITNCLNFGDPDDAEVYWQFSETIRGISDACNTLGIPVTGGNVSFYNESLGSAIYPTPVIGMVGLIDNLSSNNQIGHTFKNLGDEIWLLGALPSCFGGSEFAWECCGATGDKLPSLDVRAVEQNCAVIRQALDNDLLTAVHDVAKGGLAITLAEMTIGGKGANINLTSPDVSTLPSLMQALFTERPGCFVVSAKPQSHDELAAVLSECDAQLIGTVAEQTLTIKCQADELRLDLAKIKQVYTEALPGLVHR